MTCLRDEVLVAYADNQLRGEKLRAVEHVLAVDVDARHTVALFKLTGCHVRQAFAGIDFTGVPAWFDALFPRNTRHPRCARNAWAWKARGRTPFRWPKLGFALAASLALGICIGGLISAATTPSNGAERLLVLGELPPARAMAAAIAAYYVPAEEQARPSMDSILSMLGAQHRESTTYRNPNAP